MSKITSADFRKWETAALADGVIKADEVKGLKTLIGTQKLGADEKATLKDIVAHDRFESKSVRGDTLKLAGATKLESSPVLGKEVANGVFVQKSFSPVNGHRTKEQALAAARMSGGENLVAVEDKAGRWHAASAAKPVSKEDAKSGVATLHDCPPAAYKSLYDRAMAATGDEKTQLLTKLAALTYGVPEKDIKVMRNGDKPEAGKINVNLETDSQGNAKMDGAGQITSGCNCGGSHDNFKPGSDAYAIQVRADQLADPKKAAGVMFHELSHADDYLQAQMVFDEFKKADAAGAAHLEKADFKNDLNGVHAVKGEAALQTWLHGATKGPAGKLSTADKWKAQGYLTGKGGATEAIAYSQSFAQEFRDIVKTMDGKAEPTDKKSPEYLEYWDKLGGQLRTWAEAQKTSVGPIGGQSSKVENELKAFYATLTPDEQKRFTEVLNHIKSRYPTSDVAKLTVP